MEQLRCDIAVVGAGSAGCVVAGRVAAESDADVVLIEAGPDYGSRDSGRWPADLLDGGALAPTHQWGYDSGDLYPGREVLPFERARVMGGCSSHNGCAAVIGTVDDYDRWATLTGEQGWSADSLRPLLANAIERMKVRVYPDDEVGPFHQACLAAAAELGMPRVDDLHDLDGGIGYGVEAVNIERGVRFNAAFAYVDRARGRDNFRVLDNALCLQLEPHPDRVEVVCWRDGKEVRVVADRVVLSAGAYESPAILLRSGIGDSEELQRLGISTRHELPGVGKNLHDHASFALLFERKAGLDDEIRAAAAQRFVPEEQTLGKIRSSRATGTYDLHLVPVCGNDTSQLAGLTLIAAAHLEPRSRGHLELRSTDADAHPFIDHGYLSDPEGHDLAVLAEGIERARELAAAPALQAVLGAELSPGVGADLRDAIPRLHVHYYHPAGTCAMGPAGDRLAVCDGRARLHGVERVLVADCALMPIVPRANTNLPAVVVGERIAEWLLA